MFDFLLLFHVSDVGGRAKHFPAGGVGRVIARKDGGFCVVQLDDFRNNPIQKIAVVGYDDNRAFIVEKISLQPGNGCQIQMVCRLVQNNQIRFQKEELSQRHAGFLPAGERGD